MRFKRFEWASGACMGVTEAARVATRESWATFGRAAHITGVCSHGESFTQFVRVKYVIPDCPESHLALEAESGD
ncbi:hypothetical protein LCGC14_1636500 [marine sediment metagenome]|uniref:Uncharacterized protein n=1 Tax=marine sediment metagenome TaxID=412755 RepID=A0A0F9I0Y7_9ZZZZ